MRGSRVFVAAAIVLGVAQAVLADEGAEQRFTWHPSVRIAAEGTDNARLDADEDADFGVRIQPRLELGWDASAWELGADVEADVRRQADATDLNDAFYTARVFGEAGVLPGVTLRLANDYEPQAAVLGVPEDHASNLRQTNRAHASLRYWRELGEGIELSLGGEGGRFDSESFGALVAGPGGTPVADGHFEADHWEGGGFAQLLVPVSGRSEMYALGRARYRDYEHASEASHTLVSALVGLRAHWIRNLSFDLAGGLGVLDFGGADSEPRLLGRADLRYRLASGWRFGLGLHSRLTTDLAGNDFVDNTGRLSVERNFGTRTSATVTAFTTLLDSESAARSSDLFGGAELRLRRQLSQPFQLEVSYRFWENAGSQSANDFREHRGVIAVSYRH
jgi:hypothetical protein